MGTPNSEDITAFLSAAREGDKGALDDVWEIVYAEVRRLAHGQLRRTGPGTLSTTAVVHEAYLKLVRGRDVTWKDRGHFYAVAATAMRQVLIDHARKQRSKKRGGGERPLLLEDDDAAIDSDAAALLDLDTALRRLSDVDERLARVVELRYFAGLTDDETARALDVSIRTVRRDWRTARAFLYRELHGAGPS